MIKIKQLLTLLIACLSMHISAHPESNLQVNLSSKSMTLQELIKYIEQKTDYTFVFKSSIDVNQKVSIDEKQNDVILILQQALVDRDVIYEISGKHIILRKKDNKVQRSAKELQVQDRTIRGIIVDEGGDPLPGVSITVPGTTIGTMSNIDGEFTLAVPTSYSQVNVSFLGYKSQTVNIQKEGLIRIRLIEDIKALEEVYVIGYGTKNKNQIVGAVNQVDNETFQNKAVTNMAQALQGAIPNLNITFSDGQINRNATFNIRGYNSVNGGNPLILIDGVPGDVNLIMPEDIATVSVLKDASSAAIYGAQAAFGVILITTKKGEAGKPKFRYTANLGYGEPLKTPKMVMDPMEYARIQQLGYVGWTGNEYAPLNQVMDYLQAYKENPTLPISYVPDMYFSFISGEPTDWYGLIYNDSQPFMKHFLELSGSSDRVNYYLSGGYTKQDGVYRIATDDMNRYNMRAKLEVKINDHIKLYNNISIEESKYDSPNKNVTGSNNFVRYISQLGAPFSSPYDEAGNYSYGGMVSIGMLKDGGRTVSTKSALQNTLGAEIDMIKGDLKLKGDFSIWKDKNKGDEQKRRLSYASAPGKVAPLGAMSDYYRSAYTQGSLYTLNIYGDYKKGFGLNQFNLIAGFNQSSNVYESFWGQIEDNLLDNYGSLNLGKGLQTVGDNEYEWATRGYFYRLSYDYNKKYLAEFNGRLDGSSRFPKGSRWGFFPSVAAGWVISQEKFMEFSKSTLDLLKIRASYGSLGNQQVDAFGYIAQMYKRQMGYITNGEQKYYVTTPGLVAGDLTWETVESKNLGVDIGMLNNRLNIGLDIYQRDTKDMLTASESLPATLGIAAPNRNSADLRVEGWEASAMWRDNFKLAGKEFNYSVRFVIADNVAKITRYKGNDGRLLYTYNVGEEIGTLWGLNTLGLFQSDEEAQNWADQSEVNININNLQAGDLKFEDRNKDGKITRGKETLYDHGDLMRIGNSSPRYPYSIDLSMDWNNFDLNVFFQGIGKKDFYPGPEAALFWGFYNRWYNPVFEHIQNNYWTPENPNAYFPRPRAYSAQKSTHALGVGQTRYLQDASYLRLKTLTLGYTVPRHLTKKVFIDRFRVFFSGQNLLTFTNLSEAFDPEAIENLDGNGAGFVYPIQKVFTFGVEVNF